MVNTNQKIVWKREVEQQGEAFFEVLESGGIRILRSAVLDMFVAVVSNKTSEGNVFQIQKNGEHICSYFDGSSSGKWRTSTMRHILRVAKSDEMAIHYTGNGQAHPSSYLMLHVLSFE